MVRSGSFSDRAAINSYNAQTPVPDSMLAIGNYRIGALMECEKKPKMTKRRRKGCVCTRFPFPALVELSAEALCLFVFALVRLVEQILLGGIRFAPEVQQFD